METKRTVNLERRGIWCAIISGLLYGLLGYFGITLMNTGFSAFNTAFWRFVVSTLFLLAVVLAKGRMAKLTVRQYLLIIVNGGIFYGAPGILYFLASQYIGTGQAMVIFFIFPAFVMVLNQIFLKQPIKTLYLLSFLLIFVGLIILIDLKKMSFNLIGIGLCSLSALSYAIYIFISKNVIKSVPVHASSLLVSVGCLLSTGSLALIHGTLVFPSLPEQWLRVLGIGIICSAIPILFLFEALEHLSSDKASLLSVLEPVFVVILGVILLDEVLTVSAIFGIALVLLGAITVAVKIRVPAIFRFRRVL